MPTEGNVRFNKHTQRNPHPLGLCARHRHLVERDSFRPYPVQGERPLVFQVSRGLLMRTILTRSLLFPTPSSSASVRPWNSSFGLCPLLSLIRNSRPQTLQPSRPLTLTPFNPIHGPKLPPLPHLAALLATQIMFCPASFFSLGDASSTRPHPIQF